MKHIKSLKEIAGLRWQVLILFLAVLIGIGYMAYFVWQFYRNASAFVERYRDDDDDQDDEPEPEPEPETTNTNTANNGQATRPEPQPV